jgi:hypothetical protein
MRRDPAGWDSKSRGSHPLRVQVPPPALGVPLSDPVNRSEQKRTVHPLSVVLVVLLLGGCGLPRVPSLPAPGAPPAPVSWPGADPEAEAAAASPLHRAPLEGGCFRRHLEEAIALNELRLPVYSAWTGGASEPISRRLIAGERQGLLAARYVDRRARRYQRAGIPIVCAEFVSMAFTPALDGPPFHAVGHSGPPAPDPRMLETRIRQAYARSGFAGVVQEAGVEIEALDEAPEYHCMIRHLLESVARTAALAALHDRAAAAAGLPSTVPLSELLIRLHLAVLTDSAELDRAAAPLQAQGVSIICWDVPAIPYPGRPAQ